MSRKYSKLLFTVMLLLTITVSSFSLCFATEGESANTTANTTTNTNNNTTSSGTTNEPEQEIYSGDLYLFDDNIVMDQLIDGNAFIFGNNVEITGQINGNLFVFANKLTFNESYVRYGIFAYANSIYYNGACNDLYAATNNLEMTYDSYVVRDVKAITKDAIIKAAVGRDLDLACKTVNFGENENAPIVYGNLRYSANSEATIPEGVMGGEGAATYNKPTIFAFPGVDILIGFLTSIITILVVYVLIKKFAPNFDQKLSIEKLSPMKILKALGLGLLAFIIVLVLSILLLTVFVGAKLAFILLALFVLLYLIATPIFIIMIAHSLKPILKIEKTSMFYLILVLVSIILMGITFIPFVGGILSFVIHLIGLGLLINLFLPQKELTDEEKAAKEEAKKQAKEAKEKKKEEKAKMKESKKQASKNETKKEEKKD